MQRHKEFWEKRKGEIEAEELFPQEVFEFYSALFEYHEKYYDLCVTRPVFCSFSPEPPCINIDDMTFTDDIRGLLPEALEEITSIVRVYNEGLDFSALLDAVKKHECQPEDLLRPILRHDMEKSAAVAEEYRLGIEEYIFLMVNWLKPFLAVAGEACSNLWDNEEWQENSCPVCGSYPDMAEIVDKEEGKRYLHCSLCETIWVYMRISCTVCGNDDMKTMGYYAAADDEQFRIAYCDKCKGYIKTLRIPQNHAPSAFDLVVENLMTAYLDSAAMEKGYSRP